MWGSSCYVGSRPNFAETIDNPVAFGTYLNRLLDFWRLLFRILRQALVNFQHLPSGSGGILLGTEVTTRIYMGTYVSLMGRREQVLG